jgi:hypothetical protein
MVLCICIHNVDTRSIAMFVLSVGVTISEEDRLASNTPIMAAKPMQGRAPSKTMRLIIFTGSSTLVMPLVTASGMRSHPA